MEKEKTEQQPTDDFQINALKQKLKLARIENQITVELAQNGVSDLETASLVAKSRMKASGSLDVKEIVEKIKDDKPFLFAKSQTHATRTQPVKSDRAVSKDGLSKAAKKAAKNASRQNVFEYMKARRGWEVEVKR
ncbi:MAG: hypothetical protein ACIAQZ_00065 [Sedimentisphaeraceae bacterium JB056]